MNKFKFSNKTNVYDPTYTSIPDQCREIYQICDIEDDNIKGILKGIVQNDDFLSQKRVCTVKKNAFSLKNPIFISGKIWMDDQRGISSDLQNNERQTEINLVSSEIKYFG